MFVPIPTSTGYTSVLSNAGEISNRGIELGLSTTNISNDNFEWHTTFNIARNINRAEKLLSPITFEAREYIRTKEGAQLGSYWLYKQLYVDPQTGNAVFDDVDKDGKLTSADRQLLGNLIPDFFGGLTNSFSYKGFDLNILLTYQYGNKVYNFNRFILEGGGTRDASRSILKSQLKRWQQPGDITDVPRLTFFGNNYTIEQNSRFLEDASFVKIKSATLSYTLPEKISTRLKVDKIRLYALGTNLWILILGGVVWTLIDKKSLQYTRLYYWILVLARYRLAYGMIGWGLKKAFPMQMVFPTEGMLNTPFIDMAEKKLYWSHVGVHLSIPCSWVSQKLFPGCFYYMGKQRYWVARLQL